MSTTGEVVPRESGDFLTCVLAAPIGAMGALAVGERRGTWDRPGRSAVLGLVAACLGIDVRTRTRTRRWRPATAWRCGSSAWGPCSPTITQPGAPGTAGTGVPHPAGGTGSARSRHDPLASRLPLDVVVLVALWPRETAPRWSLKAIAEAMREPRFVPYLGRRACPLMLPLAPEIEAAADPAAALAARAERDRGLRLLSLRPAADPVVTTRCRRCAAVRPALSARRVCGVTHSPVDSAGNSI